MWNRCNDNHKILSEVLDILIKMSHDSSDVAVYDTCNDASPK